MSFKASTSMSNIIFRLSHTRRCIRLQISMSILVSLLLVAYLPYVSSTPTAAATDKTNDKTDTYLFNRNDYQTGSREDSSSLPSSVHDQQPVWYAQSRTHANQFLMPNDNDIIGSKWFSQLAKQSNPNDDDIDDYLPSDSLIQKRAAYYNYGAYPILKKRKQLAKPPMEVMNEIVNSIYL